MAQLFLSYDRADAAKARTIAEALEKAGHLVWWDLHLKGGAEYGKVIEDALAKADAVVVLWSSQSVDSAWVRDEAAAGRDSGRLIPVLIEPVSPPMGFRQYQSLDFSKWKGRGKPPPFDGLLDSVEGFAAPAEPRAKRARAMAAKPGKAVEPSSRVRPGIWIGGAILLLALIAAFFLLRDRVGSSVQTIAVEAADPAAQPLARDLLVKLSSLQGAQSGSMRLLGQEDGSANADLVFKAASSSADKATGANLVLMAGKTQEILWSKEFEQPSGKLVDLQQQMAFTAARVLGCALEGLGYDGRSLDVQTLKLYLTGCAGLSELSGSDPRPIIPTLTQVTKKAPRFGPAWGKLLIAQGETADSAFSGGNGDKAAQDALRQLIAKARKLHPGLTEIKLAEVTLLPVNAYEERIRLIDEAKRQSPDNTYVLSARSQVLRSVGRVFEAIDDADHAFAVDPLSPAAMNAYISALAYAGLIDSAREQLTQAERLWPGTASLLDIQYRFHLRFGDPQEGLRLGRQFGIGTGGLLFLTARADPSPGNVGKLRDFILNRTSNSGMLAYAAQGLGTFHLEDDLYAMVLSWRSDQDLAQVGDVWFRPQLDGFRRDPRFMQVMKRTGLLDYWRKSGKWPEFCSLPDLPYDCKAEAAKLAARPN